MGKARRNKKSKNIVLRVAVVALSVYVVVSSGITVSEIVAKEKMLADTERKAAEQEALNETLKKQVENAPEALEQKAREQGMLKQGETMYIEIAND